MIEFSKQEFIIMIINAENLLEKRKIRKGFDDLIIEKR